MKKPRFILLIGLLLAVSPSRADAWWGWLEELSGPGPFHAPWKAPLDFSFTLLCAPSDRHLQWCLPPPPPTPASQTGTREEAPPAPAPTNTQHEATRRAAAKNLLAQRIPSTGVSTLRIPYSSVGKGVDVRYLRVSSDEKSSIFPDSPDDKRQVSADILDALLWLRLHPAFDVGLGIGGIRFSGGSVPDRPQFSPFSFWKFTVTPLHVSFVPAAAFWIDPPRYLRMFRFEFEEKYLWGGLTGKDDFGDQVTHFNVPGELRASWRIAIDVTSLFYK